MVRFNKNGIILINDKVDERDKVIRCLKKLLEQKKKLTVNDLSMYRLDSLIRAITIKKIILNRLIKNNDKMEKINSLKNQLEIYVKEANQALKEMVKTGSVKTISNQTPDCNIDW